MINLAQWCNKVAEVRVTRFVYEWLASGHALTMEEGFGYVMANQIPEMQRVRNTLMRRTIWEAHDDKRQAVQHMIDFQTAEFHKFHPTYR